MGLANPKGAPGLEVKVVAYLGRLAFDVRPRGRAAGLARGFFVRPEAFLPDAPAAERRRPSWSMSDLVARLRP